MLDIPSNSDSALNGSSLVQARALHVTMSIRGAQG